MARPGDTLPQNLRDKADHGRSRRQTEATATCATLQQLVAEIPWGQNLLILNKLSAPAARLWYLRATTRFGWSRNVLLNQIKAGAYERAATEKKTHNFDLALPEHFAEQADEMLKSSYNLEFLGLRRAVRERELEDRLITRLQSFLLELGYGFCFVGRQHRIALGKKEYFIDLLFYHRFLKALVAFDLKVGPFEPEFAGKMDFYLNLLNDKERGPDDQPSIGIILCAEKDDVEVEYALRTKANPIGVAAYHLQSKLPGELKGKLPTAKQLADIVRTEMEGGVTIGAAHPGLDRTPNSAATTAPANSSASSANTSSTTTSISMSKSTRIGKGEYRGRDLLEFSTDTYAGTVFRWWNPRGG